MDLCLNREYVPDLNPSLPRWIFLFSAAHKSGKDVQRVSGYTDKITLIIVRLFYTISGTHFNKISINSRMAAMADSDHIVNSEY